MGADGFLLRGRCIRRRHFPRDMGLEDLYPLLPMSNNPFLVELGICRTGDGVGEIFDRRDRHVPVLKDLSAH